MDLKPYDTFCRIFFRNSPTHPLHSPHRTITQAINYLTYLSDFLRESMRGETRLEQAPSFSERKASLLRKVLPS